VEENLANNLSTMLKNPYVSLITGGETSTNASYCYAHTILKTTGQAFLAEATLREELFGPVTVLVTCQTLEEIEAILWALEGNLTATVHASEAESGDLARLFSILRETSGRLIVNSYPTGVEVVHAMVHGGPYPATTTPNSSSVGVTAIQRFLRPVA